MAVVQDSNLISLLIYSAYNFSNRILSIHIQLHIIILLFADVVKEQKITIDTEIKLIKTSANMGAYVDVTDVKNSFKHEHFRKIVLDYCARYGLK